MSDSERRWLEEGDQWRWADQETAAEVLRLRTTNERLVKALRTIRAYGIGWSGADVKYLADIASEALQPEQEDKRRWKDASPRDRGYPERERCGGKGYTEREVEGRALPVADDCPGCPDCRPEQERVCPECGHPADTPGRWWVGENRPNGRGEWVTCSHQFHTEQERGE